MEFVTFQNEPWQVGVWYMSSWSLCATAGFDPNIVLAYGGARSIMQG